MKVEQFFDKGLAHLSYAIVSEGEMALIDPARDPKPYYEFAEKHKATIKSVIETHLHADFISSHAEIHKDTGASIYISRLACATYPHISLDEGASITVGKLKLNALNTPGHSPDSISLVLIDEQGKQHAVFTGDTLFIGDVGRPDLRETAGGTIEKKEALAKQMYYSLRNKLMRLPDNTIVYPAHGAGSLCGKAMSKELSGTIGQQIIENYALQNMEEEVFVNMILENQPFIPKYFPYDVELNRSGAPSLNETVRKVQIISAADDLAPNVLIIDTRAEKQFKAGHLQDAINIQNGEKFETWLGSIVCPEEKFYLIASDEKALSDVFMKTAKIGYEVNIKAGLAHNNFKEVKEEIFSLEDFSQNISKYIIVDVRDKSELEEGKIFNNSIHIPLSELRERKNEIPSGKPIAVHCAGGYRSAAGASIISANANDKVYDLGENIKKFQPVN